MSVLLYEIVRRTGLDLPLPDQARSRSDVVELARVNVFRGWLKFWGVKLLRAVGRPMLEEAADRIERARNLDEEARAVLTAQWQIRDVDIVVETQAVARSSDASIIALDKAQHVDRWEEAVTFGISTSVWPEPIRSIIFRYHWTIYSALRAIEFGAVYVGGLGLESYNDQMRSTLMEAYLEALAGPDVVTAVIEQGIVEDFIASLGPEIYHRYVSPDDQVRLDAVLR
jgi:hypothetical protein